MVWHVFVDCFNDLAVSLDIYDWTLIGKYRLRIIKLSQDINKAIEDCQSMSDT
jgi:hypothetical protein